MCSGPKKLLTLACFPKRPLAPAEAVSHGIVVPEESTSSLGGGAPNAGEGYRLWGRGTRGREGHHVRGSIPRLPFLLRLLSCMQCISRIPEVMEGHRMRGRGTGSSGGAPDVGEGHRMGSIPRLPFLLRFNLLGRKRSETNKIDDVGFVNSKVRKQGITEVMLH